MCRRFEPAPDHSPFSHVFRCFTGWDVAFFVSCQILRTFIRSTFLALSAARFDFFKKSGFRTVGAHSARIHARINQYPSGRIAQKNAPIRTPNGTLC